MRLPVPALLLAFLATGCADHKGATTWVPLDEKADEATVFEDWCPADADAAHTWAADTLAAMSLEDKVAQMAGINLLSNEDGRYDTVDNEVLGIPAFRMMDGPRGAHTASGDATAFPVGMARGATWDPALEARVAAAIATEVDAVGVNVLLAPTINVLRHPRWGRSQETYGEDPHHLGVMGLAFVEGAQQQSTTPVLTEPKHYAVNSIEDTRFDVDVRIDDAALHEIYLPHFRKTLAVAGTVMGAYNHVNGPPAVESPTLLTDILRDDWAFPGPAVSDWAFAAETTEGSALAGLDIEMPTPLVYGDLLLAAVTDGRVPESVIDAAVTRILHTKHCFGLTMSAPEVDRSVRLTDDHLDLAREVAERAAVLLHNAGAFPLEDGLQVGVVGRLAEVDNIGDRGSSSVSAPDVVSVWEGLREGAGDRDLALLDETDPEAMAQVDAVVVVVGLDEDDEGEGMIAAGDREDLHLREADLTTIARATAASDRVLVVLEGGGAILVDDWIDDVEGILMAWYPGARGGEAVARLVYGAVAPSGRLPLTVPHAEADLPDFDNVSLTVTYDHWHGYRHLDRTATSARFPFGFGLTTTTFDWGTPSLQGDAAIADGGSWTVSVPVTNSGDIAAIETVQIFGGLTEPTGDRPPRELLAFGQVALDPGASGSVDLTVSSQDLRVYEDGQWHAILGDYTLSVARHAEDIEATLDVAIE